MTEIHWTVESLHDLILELIDTNDRRYEQRFSDLQRATNISFQGQKEAVQSALLAAERAVFKAESASEKRFDSVNEFRATLGDQQRLLMPRSEAEILFKSLSVRIDEISDIQKSKEGERRGYGEAFAWSIAAISIVITILSFIIKIKQ